MKRYYNSKNQNDYGQKPSPSELRQDPYESAHDSFEKRRTFHCHKKLSLLTGFKIIIIIIIIIENTMKAIVADYYFSRLCMLWIQGETSEIISRIDVYILNTWSTLYQMS